MGVGVSGAGGFWELVGESGRDGGGVLTSGVGGGVSVESWGGELGWGLVWGWGVYWTWKEAGAVLMFVY